ncbi:hypothetical protein D3C80_1485210 [compost metagenome]
MYIGRLAVRKHRCPPPLVLCSGRMIDLVDLQVICPLRLTVSKCVISRRNNQILACSQHYRIMQCLLGKGCPAKRSRRQLPVNNRPQPFLL